MALDRDASTAAGRQPATGALWRLRVLDYIDDHAAQIVRSLCQLVRTPSVSGSDEENLIQLDLARELGRMDLETDVWQLSLPELLAADDFPGVEVARREAWGVVAAHRGRGDGPSLMLNAHVDVVPTGDAAAWSGGDPFGGRADATTVYGRGACDMKGGLVAALWAARAIAAVGAPLRGDLLIGCVQGEEDGGLGTYAMLERGWRADACVIPEPTSLDLAPGASGSLTFRLRVRGSAAHAARRTSGVSAVEKFWVVFEALRRLEAARNESPHPLMGRWDVPLPIEVGVVASGDWASSVPDLLVADGRMGVGLDEDVDSARGVLAAAVAEACASDPWLREHPVGVDWWGGQFAASLTAADSPIVGAVRRAHAAVSDRGQELWVSPYGSDLRLMTNLAGVPTVHYGPGDAAVAHSPNESVSIAEVLTATRALAVLSLDHCGVW